MPTLAQNAFNNTDNRRTLLREDVRTYLPTLLDKLNTSPLPLLTMIDTAISLVKTSNGVDQLIGLAAAQDITITDEDIALLKDTDVQALLTSTEMRELLRLQGESLKAALTELWSLVSGAAPNPTANALASQAYNKYKTLLMRSDIAAELPIGLPDLKSPDVQSVIKANPSIIDIVVADPDILNTFGVFLEPRFENILKTDTEFREMLRDPLVQALLANPEAIDALIELLPEVATPETPYTVDETKRTIPIPEEPEPEPEPTPEPVPTARSESPVILEGLAASRNDFRAAPAQRVVEAGETETRRPPAIDIGEPGQEPDSENITVKPGEAKVAPIWYDTGVPPSVRYWIEWYESEGDRSARRNPYTRHPIETIFTPEQPYPDTTNREQTASVYIQAPADLDVEILYGKILIYQP